jgi:phospholipase/carboxylesterase
VPYVDPSVLIVAPRAPHYYNDDPRGNFKWTDTEMSELAIPAKFSNNVQKILELVEQLPAKEGVAFDPNKIFVGGFSQGAIISYALVGERPDLFAGVIAHSGPFNPEIEAKLSGVSLKDKPFFIAHGRTDQWVNVEQGRTAGRVLKELGVDVSYHEYDFMHETSPQSRKDLADWLSAKL